MSISIFVCFNSIDKYFKLLLFFYFLIVIALSIPTFFFFFFACIVKALTEITLKKKSYLTVIYHMQIWEP